MSGKKIRVVSDRYDKFSANTFFGGGDVIPVDMNGRRVWSSKKDSNFKEAGEDIKDYYGLEGDKGLSEGR